MWSRPIRPRVIALPASSTTGARGTGILAICIGSPRQVQSDEHMARAMGARLVDELATRERRQHRGWLTPIRSPFRSPFLATAARLRYGRRVLATIALPSHGRIDPVVRTLPYLGEPLEEEGFTVRIRGPQPFVSLDALVIVRPPEWSVLEMRVERRCERAVLHEAAAAVTSGGPPRQLRFDGWSTEEWLVRHAAAPRRERRTCISDATIVAGLDLDPHLPAADLLALRTRLIAGGGM